MPADKTASMAEAIASIEPGSTIAAGLALEHAIPFAAGHELVRQGTDDLTLVGPISDVLFDQLVGAGLVSNVRAAWTGNVSAGSGYNFRRAVEGGELDVENHSNFSIALSLHAAELGVPYLPTRSLLGSDIAGEPQFRITEDPFEGQRVVQVPAIAPDWTFVHVQRAAPTGDAHLWGNTGVTYEAVRAADNVLVTAEEIVDPEVIKSDPSRTRITREQVTAVVEAPFGAHPSPVAGRYNRDNEFFLEYAEATRDEGGFDAWADEWIHGVESRAEYREKVTRDLSVREPTTAAEVTYGQ
ncbi:CoA transferase subunit A [Halogeometricum limi]|uniref:Glutaconate CoA-transferase subunit A n=1 Tax=Halogeometricum limi TaxID=555875 RepID=A0A1I6IAQ9_9EURY|nr:CoA-transferase [Halogeometricum limi]SFR63837.1 glutaconate CoA-transferase subunit A [Halogeometricum limi]